MQCHEIGKLTIYVYLYYLVSGYAHFSNYSVV
mgnify:CR=1 FL=1|jgi:hypothetical protein